MMTMTLVSSSLPTRPSFCQLPLSVVSFSSSKRLSRGAVERGIPNTAANDAQAYVEFRRCLLSHRKEYPSFSQHIVS